MVQPQALSKDGVVHQRALGALAISFLRIILVFKIFKV
jgi:hypothetical protein